MDMRLELVIVPLSDVDRAKAFYVERAGFTADYDHVVDDDLRFVQLTPPGSACSIAIGPGLAEEVPPGTARRYPAGVPRWVDAAAPDPETAVRSYAALFG